MAANIMNTYITSFNNKKIWTLPGMFGKDKGHKAIAVRAFYGLKPAGVAFQSHLTDCT